jgi:integrase
LAEQPSCKRQVSGSNPLTGSSSERVSIHSILSGAFAAAQRWEWTDRNPAESAKPPTSTRRPIPATSPEDVAKVIAEAHAHNAALGLYLWLVVVTGVRRGELCGLQIRDIDLDRGLVHVAFNYIVRGGQRVRKDTKTHQDRWLAIDPDCCALITNYLDEIRAALHRQPASRGRLRPAQHRRAARPQRRRRDHASALRRPGPRGGQASRRIPCTADRQIYSVISSALTWSYATAGRKRAIVATGSGRRRCGGVVPSRHAAGRLNLPIR